MRRIILFIIFIFAIVIRFDRIGELAYFMIDEARDAFLVRRMLVDHRPLLIGGAIPGGVNVGPFFFYLSAIPYAISQLNPLGPAYTASLVGFISIIALYLISKKLFNQKTAIIASVFATFSLLNIVYHRPWWPLTASQLVVLITYLSLMKIKQSPRWFWILIIFLVIGAQTDPSTLSLIPVSIIWLWLNRQRFKINRQLALKGVGLFLLGHITWFIFELRHNFLNLRAIASLLSGGQGAKLDLAGPINVLKMTAAMLYRLFIPTGPLDVTKQISPCQEFIFARFNPIFWPLAILLLLIVCTYSLKHLITRSSSPTINKLISLHFLVSLTGILVYTSLFPGYIHEWLWAFMFPSFFLIFADLIYQLMKKVTQLKLPIFALLIFWSFWQFSLFKNLKNIANLGNKLNLVKQVQTQINSHPYELHSQGECFAYGGWRYLFTLYGNPPVKSYMDHVFVNWVYPESNQKPELIITIDNSTTQFPSATIQSYETID